MYYIVHLDNLPLFQSMFNLLFLIINNGVKIIGATGKDLVSLQIEMILENHEVNFQVFELWIVSSRSVATELQKVGKNSMDPASSLKNLHKNACKKSE